MKTPKRFICPARDTLCGREKPCFPWAERGIPERTELARWKRKNKERQLKRTIAKLKQELAEAKHDLYNCQSCIEVYEATADGEKMNAARWKKEATAMYSRFVHDIEGS